MLTHSPAFWTSVASTFASDPGLIFDLFNEPYDYWGTDPDPWNGWLNGDVQTQYVTGGSPYQVTAQWKTAGMQQLVSAVRAAGASQPILVNGLDWANDDSGWLTHVPSDPLGQLIAGAHIYPGEACDTVSCWSGVFPAIGDKYPVLIGETGDSSAGPVTSFRRFSPTPIRKAGAISPGRGTPGKTAATSWSRIGQARRPPGRGPLGRVMSSASRSRTEATTARRPAAPRRPAARRWRSSPGLPGLVSLRGRAMPGRAPAERWLRH